jgi:hypothetical protein
MNLPAADEDPIRQAAEVREALQAERVCRAALGALLTWCHAQ